MPDEGDVPLFIRQARDVVSSNESANRHNQAFDAIDYLAQVSYRFFTQCIAQGFSRDEALKMSEAYLVSLGKNK